MRLWSACLIALLAIASQSAFALINCGVSSSGFATAFDPNSAVTNTTQTFFTVTCTRSASGDPTSITYTVTVNNGNNAVGQNNRAALGANFVRYDVFKDSGCGTKWKGGTTITGTVNMPTTGSFSATSNFWGCVTAGQSPPAGTYIDSVLMTMTYNGTSTAASSFSVSITTPATCSMTSPSNLVFNYVSFGTAKTPSVTFTVTCTLNLGYTMALDATTGTALGLNYSLALSTASSTGTGAVQTHSVNGTMAAGQSGTCGTPTCTTTQVRSITVTY
jgi:spore coat protein U-like protein